MSRRSTDAPADAVAANAPGAGEDTGVSLDEVDATQVEASGVDLRVAEAAAAGGVVQATSAQEAVEKLSELTALGGPLADVKLTGATVDGGGEEELVVLVNAYGFFQEIDGTKYHVSAAKGDVVKLPAKEAERGKSLGALASKSDLESAQAEQEQAAE